MKITILAVGKIKEKYLENAVQEYKKRLGRYCRLEIIEVADEKTPGNSGTAEESIIRAREGVRLEKYIKSDAYIIALAINGEQMSSEAFADKINRLGINGTSHIIFIIGGSIGLDNSILNMAACKLSFSEMTFPHQLMRVILLEQVYRAYRIINGEPYHK
ncbi:MAG: 23S rRNA (pseudouridine(1915)-N(3))-methyltransferase RlmH [Lachnospiraceae bacterium]|nr:23S rRNA (pseudouridine(1915)-N(3))-methyltransferase RlmH [Lachnospiraceae bacterium]